MSSSHADPHKEPHKKRSRENAIESFDAQYERQLLLHRTWEEIEVAASEIRERYGDYKELMNFVDYLRATEKVFAEAKIHHWNAQQTKNALIQSDIDAISQRLKMDRKIFESIYDDFQNTHEGVHTVYEVAEKLTERYRDSAECVQFILYLRDIFVAFSKAQENRESLDEMQERVIKARMKVISADGDPELSVLEEIYVSFRDTLVKKK